MIQSLLVLLCNTAQWSEMFTYFICLHATDVYIEESIEITTIFPIVLLQLHDLDFQQNG